MVTNPQFIVRFTEIWLLVSQGKWAIYTASWPVLMLSIFKHAWMDMDGIGIHE